MATVEITVHGKPVILTAETIDATWAHHAQQCRECARAALAGEFYTNDPAAYAKQQEDEARRYDAREGRMSLSFIQQAVFIQTGDCPAILP